MVAGVAVFDYNNDGLPDLYSANGAHIPELQKTGPQYWNRLYRNNGDGTFTDVTEQAGQAPDRGLLPTRDALGGVRAWRTGQAHVR
jgi:hypothetical protein